MIQRIYTTPQWEAIFSRDRDLTYLKDRSNSKCHSDIQMFRMHWVFSPYAALSFPAILTKINPWHKKVIPLEQVPLYPSNTE